MLFNIIDIAEGAIAMFSAEPANVKVFNAITIGIFIASVEDVIVNSSI